MRAFQDRGIQIQSLVPGLAVSEGQTCPLLNELPAIITNDISVRGPTNAKTLDVDVARISRRCRIFTISELLIKGRTQGRLQEKRVFLGDIRVGAIHTLQSRNQVLMEAKDLDKTTRTACQRD